MRTSARKRGGLCLSTTYKNAHTKLRWRCAKGHEWDAVPTSIIHQGTWCPTCGGRQRLTIEAMKTLADERGGRCLSQAYNNNATPLHWECTEGHRWKARPANILSGTWCPVCGSRMGERICREIFEQIFEMPFPRSHPDWLRGKSGAVLELDGYCEPLKIAFEHQGAHHFGPNPFLGNARAVTSQKSRDRIKARECAARGISLILVPEIPRLLPINKTADFIISECQRLGVPPPNEAHAKRIDFSRAYSVPESKRTFAGLVRIAKAKGGRALSTSYRGLYQKLRWQCAKGHVWHASPADVKAGNWCPYCSGKKKTIRDMRLLAEQHGGECLSAHYRGGMTKLTWRCEEGHTWKAKPFNLAQGRWCPICGGSNPLSVETLREVARQRGGQCISEKYVNANTPVIWRCAKGHEWKATSGSVKNQNTWCPECAKTKRIQNRIGKTAPHTIQQMCELAAKRRGKCLSLTYKNNREHLQWKCERGHQWSVSPRSIIAGTWCPTCATRGRRKRGPTLLG